MTPTPPISRLQALDWEIRSHAWTGLIGAVWLQKLAGVYFAWKVRRKYRWYQYNRGL
jgi:hypothetical protein